MIFFFFIFWEIKCRGCLIAYKIYLILVFFNRIFDNLPLDGKGIKLNAALNLWSQGCFEWFRRSFSFGFWGVYWVTIIWAVSYVNRQATVAASALISGSSKKNLNLSISIYHYRCSFLAFCSSVACSLFEADSVYVEIYLDFWVEGTFCSFYFLKLASIMIPGSEVLTSESALKNQKIFDFLSCKFSDCRT